MIWFAAIALSAPISNPPVNAAPLGAGPLNAPAPPSNAPAAPTAEAPLGLLVIDAKVPVEVLLEGVKLGELYYPGEVRWSVTTGAHMVRVYTNGNPVDVPVALVAGKETRVLVGRNGVSTSAQALPIAGVDAGPTLVEFRLVGGGGAQIRLGPDVHVLPVGKSVSLSLSPGDHPLSVRSADGTVIWATGNLKLGGSPLVVLISEGRLPEVSGQGAFLAGGG